MKRVRVQEREPDNWQEGVWEESTGVHSNRSPGPRRPRTGVPVDDYVSICRPERFTAEAVASVEFRWPGRFMCRFSADDGVEFVHRSMWGDGFVCQRSKGMNVKITYDPMYLGTLEQRVPPHDEAPEALPDVARGEWWREFPQLARDAADRFFLFTKGPYLFRGVIRNGSEVDVHEILDCSAEKFYEYA